MMTAPDHDDLLVAVHAVVHPIVERARAHGPLPTVGSAAWTSAPAVVQVAVLLVLAEAWIVGTSMVDEVAHEDYAGGRYHRPHLFPAISELQRRRYPPTGDRDLWIKYGPTGPPGYEAVPATLGRPA